MTKQTYGAPVMRSHGSVEAITKATSSGEQLDQALSNDTPLTTVLSSLS